MPSLNELAARYRHCGDRIDLAAAASEAAYAALDQMNEVIETSGYTIDEVVSAAYPQD